MQTFFEEIPEEACQIHLGISNSPVVDFQVDRAIHCSKFQQSITILGSEVNKCRSTTSTAAPLA